jgi:Ca2+-binding RTX toxin-like protein
MALGRPNIPENIMAIDVAIGNQSSQYDLSNSATIYTLAAGTAITSSAHGIFESDAWHQNTIQVNGSINATTANKMGVYINGLETTVNIGETGNITAYYGLYTYGEQTRILNDGSITGTSGIAVAIAFCDGSELINNGTIAGEIFVDRSDNTRIVLNESSVVINETGSTMDIATDLGQTSHIINKGVVTSGNWSFYGRHGNETLINRGSFEGAMSLGDGDDNFDNRGGTISREIYGDRGNDMFILDKKIEIREYVGEGIDTIKTTVAMNLSTGLLEGQEIENLILLGKKNLGGTGNDFANAITGNSGNNKLFGLDGADTIDGGKGNDRLDGGLAADILTGGKGADIFVFKTGYGADTVTDLTNGTDRIDLKGLDEVTSFADLKSNHLTVSGNDLVITAGTDTLTIEDTKKSELDASDFLF